MGNYSNKKLLLHLVKSLPIHPHHITLRNKRIFINPFHDAKNRSRFRFSSQHNQHFRRLLRIPTHAVNHSTTAPQLGIDVRRTLPYAILISQMIMETYRMLEMLPDDRARQQHLNQMDRYLRREYTPRMNQLTRRQGEILMLLIDRETGTSSFHIIQATMGSVQALAANAIARLWGNNLRTRFDPHNNSEHRMIERIAIELEMGVI